MKVESAEIKDEEFVSKVIDATKQMETDIKSLVNTEYDIIELRVNLKEGRVFVIWENYDDDVNAIKSIVSDIVKANEQLEKAESDVEKADAIIKLGKLNDNLNRIYKVSLKDAIAIVKNISELKAQGLSISDIVESTGYPYYVVKAVWEVV